MINGTSGNGISRLNATWLSTSILNGSIPRITATVTGIILMNLVMILRTHKFILNPVSPSITDWPARVPVTEEEIPEDNNATAKTRPANFPNSGIKVEWAWSSVATFIPAL